MLRVVGWLLIVSALVLAGAAAWIWNQPNEYTVVVDGSAQNVQGRFETVADVLAAASVQIEPHDLVSLPLSAAIEDDGTVKIEKARGVEVQTGNSSQIYWTHQESLVPFLLEANIGFGPSFDIRVDGQPISYDETAAAALGDVIYISKVKTIALVDEGERRTITTDTETVGQLLAEVGVSLLEADSLSPAADSWLTPDLQIVITRTKPVVIAVDGAQISLKTDEATTRDILAQAGVQLGELDYSLPGPEFIVSPGNIVRVVRVQEELIFEDEVIPYESLFQGTDELEIDQRALLSAGEPGLLRRQVRVRYEDGLEVHREVDSEWIEKAPVNEVNGYGTRILIRTLETPEGTYEYWRAVRMRVTAYTASSSGKPPDHPNYGVTASGVTAGTGVVAIDPKVVPFRSWVYVPGYGVGYAGDTGGGIKGRWIDLGYDEDELVAWSSYTDVYYLTPVPPSDKINYLIPTVLP